MVYSSYKERLKSLWHHPRNYPELLWVVFVFLGGAANAVVIKNFIDFILPIYQYTVDNKVDLTGIPNWQILLALIVGFGLVVFIIPIVCSFIFSRVHPENRLAPPLYIQMVSFGLLAYFFYNQFADKLPILLGIGYYAAIGGLVQDSIATFAFGSTVFTKDLASHSFEVWVDTNKVRELILSKEFQKRFNLGIIKTEKEETTKLRTKRRRGFTTLMEYRSGELKSQTIVNLVFYDMGWYSVNPIKENDQAYDWVLSQIDLIKGYLSRHLSVEVLDAANENVESLMTFVIDEMAGSISHFQELAIRKQVLLIISAILMGVSIVPFVLEQIDVGLIVLLAGLALLADLIFRE
jgi:hypothetical protein